jgi:DNA processing protein
MDERAYWLGFSRVSGIGRVALDSLRGAFSSLAYAWEATPSQLREAGLSEYATKKLVETRAKLNLSTEIRQIEGLGVSFITLPETTYPTLLKTYRGAPPVLYVRGELSPLDEKALAVVGTRKATRYGRDMAQQFCGALAQAGVTIISGLALGIDATAHIAALEAGGRTIGILGNGIDVIYPRENAPLFRRIIDSGQGALLSHFPPGTRPDGSNFPRRNAIMSGLALGTLVVEAPMKSGSLHTVNAALDQGREVFAIPHSLQNMMGTACNQLIQEGAKLVIEARDILDELNIVAEIITTRTQTERIAPTSPEEAKVLSYLTDAPIHVDDLARAIGLSIADLSVTLTLLELKGLAQRVGAMQYCL